jgi:hypothetical protein
MVTFTRRKKAVFVKGGMAIKWRTRIRKLKAIEACLREQAGKRQTEASRTLLNLAEDLASVEENLRTEIGCHEIHDYDVFPFGHIKVN